MTFASAVPIACSNSHEEGGAAEHHAGGLAAHAGRASPAHEAQKARDDVGEQVALEANLRLLLEQRRPENAFERPHQPAGIVREMPPHRLAPIGDAVVLEAEEHRRRDRVPPVLQGEHV
jgi:hypothetical protein